ncbi:MAG: ParB/RepB/Spo0J family partition protein [Firmicutes bacterium]|nr:ParB/RepB/Spo0J family partition protein [Bacillota bacterium]
MTEMSAWQVEMVPLAKIQPRKGAEVRLRADEDEDDLERLAASIVHHGLIHPLTVVRRKGGNFELISGLRRYAAMRQVWPDTKKVPVHVVQATPIEQQEQSLAENLHRRDLHPLEVAQRIDALMRSNSWSLRHAAEELRISVGYASSLLRCYRNERLHKAMEKGDLSPSLVVRLARLLDSQGKALEEGAIDAFLTWIGRARPTDAAIAAALRHYLEQPSPENLPTAARPRAPQQLPQTPWQRALTQLERHYSTIERRAIRMDPKEVELIADTYARYAQQLHEIARQRSLQGALRSEV